MESRAWGVRSTRFEYCEPWRSVVALVALAAIGFGAGAYQVRFGYPDAPPLAGPVAGVPLIGLGVFFLGLAFWTTFDRWLRRRAVEVGGSAISLPRSRWSASRATVPLDEIASIRTSKSWDSRLVEIASAERRYVVRSSMLPRAGDFDRLLDLLGERLGKDRLKDAAEAGGRRRLRPQFSLAGLFVLVTLVAVILGTHRYVYGKYSWDTLLDVGAALAVLVMGPGIALGLSGAGRWRPVQVFFLAFVVGYFVDLLAGYLWLQLDWVRYAPGSGVPRNGYPLSFAVQRLAGHMPGGAQTFAARRGAVLGGVLSGLAWGAAAVALAWTIARARSWARTARPAKK